MGVPLREQLAVMERARDQLGRELAKAQHATEIVQAELGQLRQRFAEVCTQRGDARWEANELARTVERLKEQLQVERDAAVTVDNGVEQVRAQLASALAKVEQLQESLDVVTGELQDSENRCGDLFDEVAGLKFDLEHAQAMECRHR